MKLFHTFPILFLFVLFCTSNVVAQQTTGTTEEKNTQGTVFRTVNPNYVEQAIPGGKVSSERMKNPAMEVESTSQKSEPNSVVTNEKTKNPVDTEEENK